jgi:hypothetical protein
MIIHALRHRKPKTMPKPRRVAAIIIKMEINKEWVM